MRALFPGDNPVHVSVLRAAVREHRVDAEAHPGARGGEDAARVFRLRQDVSHAVQAAATCARP